MFLSVSYNGAATVSSISSVKHVHSQSSLLVKLTCCELTKLEVERGVEVANSSREDGLEIKG